MRWFANLKIAHKLGVGFSLGIVITCLIGMVSLAHMNIIAAELSETYQDELMVEKVGELRGDIHSYQRAEKGLIIETSEAGISQYVNQMNKSALEFDNDLVDMKSMSAADKGHTGAVELEEAWQTFQPLRAKVVALARANQNVEAQALAKTAGRAQSDKIEQIIADFAALKAEQGQKRNADATARVASSRSLIILLVAIATVLSLLTGGLITRLITRSLSQVTERMETLRTNCLANLGNAVAAMAEGDLTITVQPTTQPLTIQTREEFGQMAATFNGILAQTQQTVHAYNRAQQSLCTLVEAVTQSAEAVTHASRHLSLAGDQTSKASRDIARSMQEVASAADQSATASHEMAQGSEQQARSASEAAAEMEQLYAAIQQTQARGQQQQEAVKQADAGIRQASQSVKEVVRSSQQMAEAARRANNVAQTSGKTVEQTVAGMNRIEAQVTASAARITELGEMGKAIGAIVGTIDQIAEQTNLLALNAAIEAARAGAHGKGFAVVAEEVRELAERSAAATTEVRALIDKVRRGVAESVQSMQASRQEVTEGARRSHDAGQALIQILQATQSVAVEVENVFTIAQQMATSVQAVTVTVDTVRHSAEANEQDTGAMAARADQVSYAIASVATVSEETAAGAEEMSASAEAVSSSAQQISVSITEQEASVEAINVAASELSVRASGLQELVSQFKLASTEVQERPALRMTTTRVDKAA